jgi:hypothetical protein
MTENRPQVANFERGHLAGIHRQEPALKIQNFEAVSTAFDQTGLELFAFTEGIQGGLEGFLFKIGDLRGWRASQEERA